MLLHMWIAHMPICKHLSNSIQDISMQVRECASRLVSQEQKLPLKQFPVLLLSKPEQGKLKLNISTHIPIGTLSTALHYYRSAELAIALVPLQHFRTLGQKTQKDQMKP